WARPEVIGALELLRQQRGANNLAVLFHQTPVGLVVKCDLRKDRHDDRIHYSGHDTPQNRLSYGLGNKFDHSISSLAIFGISDIKVPGEPTPKAYQSV